MYPKVGDLPTPLYTADELEDLGIPSDEGDVNETPFNVFIGHNLGHRVFTISVPFRKFYEISDVANDRESGPVAQRPLDANHARKLAIYMVKGLVSAAKMRRIVTGKGVPAAFDEILKLLGDQPYFSIQPIVCNIRDVPMGGLGEGGIRSIRISSKNDETAGFKVFLAERHILWVVDGQHRRYAAEMAMSFLDHVRRAGKYPGKGAVLFVDKGRQVTEDEMVVWNDAFSAARAYATLTVEVHLGLLIDQERQLFHDLNRLGKKVDASLAFQFDGSNPITHFIKSTLVGDLGITVTESESKDWQEDSGALVLKDLVAINALAFLNKGNIAGATPSIVEPRQSTIMNLWSRIVEIPNFGSHRAKEKTVAAQPVVLKALSKIAFDLSFSNRRPADGAELYEKFLDGIEQIDFAHSNPMWRYYGMNAEEREAKGLSSMSGYLPDEAAGANRDIGSYQSGFMRFGAKHNDIYPILADMIRWKLGLPNRREP
jgi:hypothetical protein